MLTSARAFSLVAFLIAIRAAHAEDASPGTSLESSSKRQGSAQPTEGRAGPALGLWGRPVVRGGFHFQLSFGIGGGPDTLGLFHDMELGATFGKRGQHTIALLHTFIQNRNMLGTDLGGPDLIGGWMLEYKRPIFYPDLVVKVAAGLGGTHDQSGEGLQAYPGLGLAYGLDLHLPLTKRFGPSLTALGMHVTSRGRHHFGAALGLGITLF